MDQSRRRWLSLAGAAANLPLTRIGRTPSWRLEQSGVLEGWLGFSQGALGGRSDPMAISFAPRSGSSACAVLALGLTAWRKPIRSKASIRGCGRAATSPLA